MAKKNILLAVLLSIALSSPVAAETITAFLGSATKPAMDDINKLFTKKTGVEIFANYGGSGSILSQMKLAKRGDIYLCGSPDFMEKAKKENLVYPDSEKIIAYLIPAINVPKGNPKNINSLHDLTEKDVQLIIGNPRFVCLGLYAVEIFEANHVSALIKPKIKSYTESCERTANIIALGGADAVMGWKVFQEWNPNKIQTILLKPKELPRISYIPIAVSTFTSNRKLAEEYLQFVVSPESRAIFKKWGYITEEQEAKKYAPQAKIGGEYTLPEGW